MNPNIGLSDESRDGVIGILNTLLSDEYVLGTETRSFHWNVTGPHFHDLHALFEAQYEELEAIVDETAERVRQLGGRALGTLAEFLEHTRIRESPGETLSAPDMLASLLHDHEAVIRSLRKDVERCDEHFGDACTDDFLTGVMQRHEKMAWMLRAILTS